MQRRFMQLDVFTSVPLMGNPLAVVLDAQGLDEAAMRRFARWTNLSETTFVLPPEDPGADYRVRIFTPDRELPFAGHPTLGTCHAWLHAGGRPSPGRGDVIVQQCGVGLVRVQRRGSGAQQRLAFAAPPLLRSGPVEAQTLLRIAQALNVPVEAIVRHQWVCNGPQWCAVMLASAQAVLDLRPDFTALQALGMDIGVVGPCPDGSACRYEVRALLPTPGVQEDPVTGSLNAGLAQWLIGAGLAPDRYVVGQGTAIGRSGRVHVERQGDHVWIGGHTVVLVEGSVSLPAT